MNQHTHKRLYHWHSRAGLITTLLLIALCITAVPAIFLHDIAEWFMPSVTEESVTEPKSLDEWVQTAGKTLPIYDDEFHLRPSHIEGQSPTIWMKKDGSFQAFVHKPHGEFEPHHGAAAIYTLAHAHYDFLIPAPYGEYLVGLVGLSMLALVFMGVLLHKKWRKEKTQMRKGRSKRLYLSDVHKLLGLWLLPFHIFISYTGAVLGLGGLLLIVAAISAFDGDKDAAIAAVIGEEPIMSGEVCEMKSIDSLAAQANQYWAERYGSSVIEDIEIHGLNDCNAQVTITSEIPGYLLLNNAISYSMKTGETNNVIDWIPSGFGERWYALVGPLHFGTFAGYVSQWLYAISALLLVAMTMSGMLLWLDKNASKEQLNATNFVSKHGFIKASLGITLGISTSTILVIMAAKFLPAFGINIGYSVATFTAIYAVCFLLVLAGVYYLNNADRLTLGANGLLYVMAPFVSWAIFGFDSQHIALELTLLGVGLLFLFILSKYKLTESSDDLKAFNQDQAEAA